MTFQGSATNERTFWLWDFGDGGTSTRQNEVHTFQKAGFFKVSLTVTNSTGSKKSLRTLTVLPSGGAASFIYSPTSPIPGETVQFTDTTPGNPTSWLWDFGDGGTSTLKNPLHAFATTGFFKVTLLATNATGSWRTSRTIIIATASTLSVSFSYSPLSPSIGKAVQFKNLSTGAATSWLWKFGDGATSALRDPAHAFSAAGSYTVSLTATSNSGSKTASQTLVVGSSLKASFTYNPSAPAAGQAVQFTDASTGGPTSWWWNFNDGSTSSERNPIHAFTNPGAFNVVLMVSDGTRSDSVANVVVAGSGPGLTGPYWVSPAGTASWAMARSETPLYGAACCSLATANAYAAAGDTVYLRGGTYGTSIYPARSGTAGNRITFQAYAGERPIFTVGEEGGRWAVKLQGRSYITVRGISSVNSGGFFYIGYGSCYNELADCVFDRSAGMYSLGIITWLSSDGAEGPGSDHNWIHHCAFSRYGWIQGGDDEGTVRISANFGDPTKNNTFENNVFFYGGHDCLDVGGQYNVVRNNVFHNEEAYFADTTRTSANRPGSGYFGNRCILLSNSGNNPGTAYHTLIEGNRIGYAGTPPDDDGACGIENAGAHTIVRYNDIFGNGTVGYYSKMQPGGAYPSPLNSGSWARVYNNTIYHNGFGDPSLESGFRTGVLVWSYAAYNDWPKDVVVKNNIVYDNYREWGVGSDNILPQVTYENNYNQDPVFLNTDMSDKTSWVLPDLRLQSASPCVNAGSHLTLARGSGSTGTTLVVEDAYLFQDGTWGSALTHGVTHFPDWIAIGTVDNIVKIASVDYAAKTVTLAAPATWSDGARIWLFSDSGGRQVLIGPAPDFGAHEAEIR